MLTTAATKMSDAFYEIEKQEIRVDTVKMSVENLAFLTQEYTNLLTTDGIYQLWGARIYTEPRENILVGNY
jgi:hypothetical protein